MTTQPTALRLADWLLDWLGHNVEPADLEAACVASAAELRRLHEANQELLGALKSYGAHASNCDHLILLTSMPPQRKHCSCGLHDTIARAEGRA